MRQLRTAFIFIAFALLLVSVPRNAVASITYLVTADTSSVASTPGFIDLNFAGSGMFQPATAVVSNFMTDGSLSGSPILNFGTPGGASGALNASPFAVTFDNALNGDYFQGVTFGNHVSFDLTLSGPAVDSPDPTITGGSSFGLGFYDSGQNVILDSSGTGNSGILDINPLGAPISTVSNGANVTFTVTPEPSFAVLLAALSMLLFLVRKRLRARHTALSARG